MIGSVWPRIYLKVPGTAKIHYSFRMNRNITVEGITIKANRVGEYHKAVSIVTREAGIIDALLYGAYKGTGRLSGTTEPFRHVSLQLYHNPIKNSNKIVDGELLGMFNGLHNSLAKLYLAYSWAELLLKTECGGATTDPERDAMFQLFGRSLGVLSRAPGRHIVEIGVQFLWRLLGKMGYQVELSECGRCGSPLDGHATYDQKEHRLLCSSCTLPGGILPLPFGAIGYLQKTLGGDIGMAITGELSEDVLLGLEEIPQLYITGELGVTVKTPSYREHLR